MRNDSTIASGLKQLTDAVSKLTNVLAQQGSGAGSVSNADLKKLLEQIIMTQKEAAEALQLAVKQLNKLDGDTKVLQTSVDTANARIVELEAVIAAGDEASPELIAAVQAVKDAVQIVDDNVPEVPTPPNP